MPLFKLERMNLKSLRKAKKLIEVEMNFTIQELWRESEILNAKYSSLEDELKLAEKLIEKQEESENDI